MTSSASARPADVPNATRTTVAATSARGAQRGAARRRRLDEDAGEQPQEQDPARDALERSHEVRHDREDDRRRERHPEHRERRLVDPQPGDVVGVGPAPDGEPYERTVIATPSATDRPPARARRRRPASASTAARGEETQGVVDDLPQRIEPVRQARQQAISDRSKAEADRRRSAARGREATARGRTRPSRGGSAVVREASEDPGGRATRRRLGRAIAQAYEARWPKSGGARP